MSNLFRILLSDKEEDITSFSSLNKVKREYRGEKVGHAGTLDRFASGLMIVMVGGATKLNPIFSSFGKRYTATVKFGQETDTLDREGSVKAVSEKIPTEEELLGVLPEFIGAQKQIPPVYSAIHIDGKRAYQEARKQKDIAMPERDIFISSISLLSFSSDTAVIDCTVSKGTYIRSLARDIAIRCGSRGYLTALRRTEVGPFTLSDLDLSTDELLEKTGLFGEIHFTSLHRKEIDNGTIRKDWIVKSVNPARPYSVMYIDGEKYAYCEKKGDAVSVMARVM